MKIKGARRLLRQRVVWGALTAIAGTAVAAVVTLPLDASGDNDRGERAGSSSPSSPGSPAVGAVEEGTSAAPAAGREGTGGDPLTAAEEERAEQLALAGDRPLRTDSENASGDQGAPQHLWTDLADAPVEEGDRLAEVYYYDYADDTLVLKTVNLTSGKVEDSQTSTGAQPPPARQEAAEAAQVLVDSPLSAGLKQDFEAATGKQLTSAGQLEVQGIAYSARPSDSGELAQCGEHRCMQLFTRVPDGPWIDTRNYVIDLSDRKVHNA